MHTRTLVLALAPTFLASYVLAAVPNPNVINGAKADQRHSARSGAEVLAQEQAGLEAQEAQLLNQIQADDAKLRADEAAERAHQKKPANPQIQYIRASLLHLSEASSTLQHASPHYHGYRGAALKSMAEAHNQLMQCYRIDSGQ